MGLRLCLGLGVVLVSSGGDVGTTDLLLLRLGLGLGRVVGLQVLVGVFL